MVQVLNTEIYSVFFFKVGFVLRFQGQAVDNLTLDDVLCGSRDYFSNDVAGLYEFGNLGRGTDCASKATWGRLKRKGWMDGKNEF